MSEAYWVEKTVAIDEVKKGDLIRNAERPECGFMCVNYTEWKPNKQYMIGFVSGQIFWCNDDGFVRSLSKLDIENDMHLLHAIEDARHKAILQS